jgi:hypothetical protein
MSRTRRIVLSVAMVGLLGVARGAAAAPFTDHFAPLDAELASIQAELEASADPLEQKAALLVAKARQVLESASDGLRGDARLAQKLITKLAKALGDDLTSLPPPADELAPILEKVLVELADDVVAKIDGADVAADTLPEGDKKTTKALKALDRALGTLDDLAAAGGPTLEHARAIFKAASALCSGPASSSRPRSRTPSPRRRCSAPPPRGSMPSAASLSSTWATAWCSGPSGPPISPGRAGRPGPS